MFVAVFSIAADCGPVAQASFAQLGGITASIEAYLLTLLTICIIISGCKYRSVLHRLLVLLQTE